MRIGNFDTVGLLESDKALLETGEVKIYSLCKTTSKRRIDKLKNITLLDMFNNVVTLSAIKHVGSETKSLYTS